MRASAAGLGGLLPPIQNFVMGGPGVEMGEHVSRWGRHVRDFVVLTYERFDRANVREPHDRHELKALWNRAAHEVDREKARDVRCFDRGNYFTADDRLLAPCIVDGRPAPPDPADHLRPPQQMGCASAFCGTTWARLEQPRCWRIGHSSSGYRPRAISAATWRIIRVSVAPAITPPVEKATAAE